MTHAALVRILTIIVAAPLTLAGCGEKAERRSGPEAADLALPLSSSRIAPEAQRTAPTLDEAEKKGEAGARAVLMTWADALERGDWTQARAQWGHGGTDSGLDEEAFAAQWRRYQRLDIHVGQGEVDGAAGSLYYEVPVSIDAVLRDGRVVRLAGPVTLRRVNDVDGASAEDLAWHIGQSDLRPRP